MTITRAQLRASGVSDRQIARLVAAERLLRLRGGVFAEPSIDKDLAAAVRAGGRLACASELKRLGVWVLDHRLHVHFVATPQRLTGAVRHWRALHQTPSTAAVSALDAVVEMLHCLPRDAALASLDSALHLRLVSRQQVDEASLSAPARRIADLADSRAESGLESIARLICHDLGLRSRSQVRFAGVGHVDLLIEDVLVIEADGDRYHSDLAARRRDRRRDAKLAAAGFPVLRFGYDQLVGDVPQVVGAIIGTVENHPGVKNARRIVDRARREARKRRWA